MIVVLTGEEMHMTIDREAFLPQGATMGISKAKVDHNCSLSKKQKTKISYCSGHWVETRAAMSGHMLAASMGSTMVDKMGHLKGKKMVSHLVDLTADVKAMSSVLSLNTRSACRWACMIFLKAELTVGRRDDRWDSWDMVLEKM